MFGYGWRWFAGVPVRAVRLPQQQWRCWQIRNLFGWSRDKESRIKKRQELWAEASQGYFADLHEFRRNRGKSFEAADHLCTVKEASKFSVLTGKSLDGSPFSIPTDQISLVLISLRGIGMKMCEMYRVPFEREFIGHNDVAVYELSLVDKLFYRIMRSLIERNLKKAVLPERQSSFLCYTGKGGPKVKELIKTIGLRNSIVGHAYLLDSKGYIRWRATAVPTQRELQTMIKCTKQLIVEKNRGDRI